MSYLRMHNRQRPPAGGAASTSRKPNRGVLHADVEPGFSALFDGTEASFRQWETAGPGSFRLRDGLLVAEPADDHSVLFYAARRFGDFVLRLQFRLPGPLDHAGRTIGNSGVFLRFRYPHSEWEDVNRQQPQARHNPAWVAAVTGFEIQIDEQGMDDYAVRHRTGAVYDVSAGEEGGALDQIYTPGPPLAPGTWYDMEIAVTGDEYIVHLGEAGKEADADDTRLTVFRKPADKYLRRGLAPSADNESGYIGVQAHTGEVAFRQIRIKELP